MSTKPTPRYVYRSAITGKFVSRAYAEAHPETTIKEKISGPPCH